MSGLMIPLSSYLHQRSHQVVNSVVETGLTAVVSTTTTTTQPAGRSEVNAGNCAGSLSVVVKSKTSNPVTTSAMKTPFKGQPEAQLLMDRYRLAMIYIGIFWQSIFSSFCLRAERMSVQESIWLQKTGLGRNLLCWLSYSIKIWNLQMDHGTHHEARKLQECS